MVIQVHPVSHIKIKRGMTMSEIAAQMAAVKVLGPGRFGKAVNILTEMFRSKEYCKLISLAGPIVPGGLRRLLVELVDEGLLDGIVTTGANVTHDMLEGLGHRHIVGSETADDEILKRRGLSRIYDLLVKTESDRRFRENHSKDAG